MRAMTIRTDAQPEFVNSLVRSSHSGHRNKMQKINSTQPASPIRANASQGSTKTSAPIRVSPLPPVAAPAPRQNTRNPWLAKAAIVIASVSMTVGGWAVLAANEQPATLADAAVAQPVIGVTIIAPQPTQPAAAQVATIEPVAQSAVAQNAVAQSAVSQSAVAPAIDTPAPSPTAAPQLRVVTIPTVVPRRAFVAVTRSSK